MSQSRREAWRRQQEAQARGQRNRRIVIVGALVLLLVVVGVIGTALVQNIMNNNQSAGTGAPPNATPNKDGIMVNPGKAAANAPSVVIYLDYQCPVCKQFEDVFGPTIEDLANKGEISLEYRTITILDTNLHNDSSVRSALAAACADTVGAYQAYHDAVFAAQPEEGKGYTTDQLRTQFAQTAGITGENLTKFQQCYDSRAMSGFVNGVVDQAARAGVNSTPTIQRNGQTIPNNSLPVQNPADIRKLLLGQ